MLRSENEKGAGPDWLDTSTLQSSPISSRFKDDFEFTFSSTSIQAGLQIYRVQNGKVTSDRRGILEPAEVGKFYDSQDNFQIFLISQKNSYSRLNITRDVFEELVRSYNIFERIWDFILPFGFKTRELDIGHAPFRFHQSGAVSSLKSELGTYECVYGFRYVELNHRIVDPAENADYDRWSIRQTVVYHKYDGMRDRCAFLLICPASAVRDQLEAETSAAVQKGLRLNPFEQHRIALAAQHDNWRLYLKDVEKGLVEQSDRVTLTKVRNRFERLSPLTDFAVNFIDRQRLKKTEDKILDLAIIFESLYNTLARLERQCRIHCLHDKCKDCKCSAIIEEFEEQRYEVQVNLKKAENLHKRAQGTAQLLSDLLDYENAQIAHHNEVSLNGLVAETKDENSKMRLLTERSAQDAAAVKILTVITLVYLPMSVVLVQLPSPVERFQRAKRVQNFFSTQLVHVNEAGQISLISHSWWFVIVALPLTIVTFLTWRIWLWYTMIGQGRNLHGTFGASTIGSSSMA